MRRAVTLAVVLMLLATACDQLPFAGGGGNERTVLVDFSHDEYASLFLKNFPRKVTIAQGDEILFRQTWTGEPHSVTGGTLVNALMKAVDPILDAADKGEPIPDEPPEEVIELEEDVPFAFNEEGGLNQTASQPCYLSDGKPRKDGKPCNSSQQEQIDFDGTHTYYNSGVIPYEGPAGNEYRVKFADDIKPGDYWFYCNVHGPLQSSKVTVRPKGAEIPSQAEVSRQARKEVDKMANPLLEIFRDAQGRRVSLDIPEGGGPPTPNGGESPAQKLDIRGNFAGLFSPEVEFAGINEMIPGTIRAEAGEKITWNLIGWHSISFGVPRYFPPLQFLENGTVRLNPKLEPAAGGAKKFDIPEEDRYGGRPDPLVFDGGTYDGTGFWSSGMIDAEPYIEYSMRITKPGTYDYACLVHPPMVGKVVVT